MKTFALFLLPLLVSCGSFSGDVVFRNQSKGAVSVTRVEGFEKSPVPGTLIAGTHAAFLIGRSKAPDVAVLHWSESSGVADHVVALPIEIPVFERNAVILFTYRLDGTWEVESGLLQELF